MMAHILENVAALLGFIFVARIIWLFVDAALGFFKKR
jgi:hypothetical protein